VKTGAIAAGATPGGDWWPPAGPAKCRGQLCHLYRGRLFVYILGGALGLNHLNRYAGQVSLGHARFSAIGAYTAAGPGRIAPLALRDLRNRVRLLHDRGYLLDCLLRLSGSAMATLGFTLIVQEMLLQLSVITHGSEGMSVPARRSWGLPSIQITARLPIIWRDLVMLDTDAESGTGADGAAFQLFARTKGRLKPWALI